MLEKLKVWEETVKQMEFELQALSDMLMASPEAPLFLAASALITEYTKEISAQVGDTCDWLGWYAYENNFGQAEMEVSLKGEEFKKIVCLEDLVWVLESK